MKIKQIPQVTMEEGDMHVFWNLMDGFFVPEQPEDKGFEAAIDKVKQYLDSLLTQAYNKGVEATEKTNREIFGEAWEKATAHIKEEKGIAFESGRLSVLQEQEPPQARRKKRSTSIVDNGPTAGK